MARPDPTAGFKRETHTINGVKTVVLTAGHGEPLVFLHGAGTWHGFNFALPWAEKFRVIDSLPPGLRRIRRRSGAERHARLRHALSRPVRCAGHRQAPAGRILARRAAGGEVRRRARPPGRAAGPGGAGRPARQHPSHGRLAELAAGTNPGDAGVEFRRDQTVSAGKAQRYRFHGRPLSRRRHAGAPVVGASLRHQIAALSAPADHADVAGVGRR